MLLLMLGAVLALMRQLEQPETVAYLDRVLSSSSANDEGERPPRRELPEHREGEVPTKPSLRSSAATGREPSSFTLDAARTSNAEDGPWAAVEDNSMFLEAEHEAWFLLWGEAKKWTPAELDEQSLAEVTYAQLINQPDTYRGQAVRVRGRILRESVKRAPENLLGITDYHQLVLAPIGGGDWPVIVYCLDLPPGFPRGDRLQEDVALTGLFFKNWSSPDGEGMGLFPVLVARSFDWQPPPSARMVKAADADMTQVWIGASAAIVATIGFITWVSRQTGRRRVAETAPPDFQRLDVEP